MPTLPLSRPDDTGPSPRVGAGHEYCPSGSMRVLGYVQRSPGTRLDCSQPLRVVCRECAHTEYWRCDCSAEAKCPECAERRRKLIARLVHLGTTDRASHGFTYFVTLSAPGEREHRRWVQVGGEVGVRRLPADRPHCDCHTVWEHSQRGDWNSQESACWNRLRISLSRLVGGTLAYIGSVEVQKRGMLHRHLVLHSPTPLLASDVGDLALAAGYGCVHDVQPIHDAGKAAWYISKYVTKSSGQRDDVPWRADFVDEQTGEIQRLTTRPTFRTWSSSHSWGYTLKDLRAIAQLQARARAKYLRELTEALEHETAAARSGFDPSDPEPEHDPPPI